MYYGDAGDVLLKSFLVQRLLDAWHCLYGITLWHYIMALHHGITLWHSHVLPAQMHMAGRGSACTYFYICKDSLVIPSHLITLVSTSWTVNGVA